MLEPRPGLNAWLDAMNRRSSVKKTQPDFG
jgi:hypothetical protein